MFVSCRTKQLMLSALLVRQTNLERKWSPKGLLQSPLHLARLPPGVLNLAQLIALLQGWDLEASNSGALSQIPLQHLEVSSLGLLWEAPHQKLKTLLPQGLNLVSPLRVLNLGLHLLKTKSLINQLPLGSHLEIVVV